MNCIRGVVRRTRPPLVGAILADENATGQGMIGRREADRVSVSITPREGLDMVGIAQLCAQDGPVADPLPNLTGERIKEGRDGSPFIRDTEGRIAAGEHPAARA